MGPLLREEALWTMPQLLFRSGAPHPVRVGQPVPPQELHERLLRRRGPLRVPLLRQRRLRSVPHHHIHEVHFLAESTRLAVTKHVQPLGSLVFLAWEWRSQWLGPRLFRPPPLGSSVSAACSVA